VNQKDEAVHRIPKKMGEFQSHFEQLKHCSGVGATNHMCVFPTKPRGMVLVLTGEHEKEGAGNHNAKRKEKKQRRQIQTTRRPW
jgi:hypothetical protein